MSNEPQTKSGLFDELQQLLNKHSAENASNTPDFLLANFLMGVLRNYNETVSARDKWFGVDVWANDKLLEFPLQP
jgi:hypothetical protein